MAYRTEVSRVTVTRASAVEILLDLSGMWRAWDVHNPVGGKVGRGLALSGEPFEVCNANEFLPTIKWVPLCGERAISHQPADLRMTNAEAAGGLVHGNGLRHGQILLPSLLCTIDSDRPTNMEAGAATFMSLVVRLDGIRRVKNDRQR
jgi:hypothetical protein